MFRGGVSLIFWGLGSGIVGIIMYLFNLKIFVCFVL